MKNTIELPGKRYEGAEIKQQAELVDFIRENKVDSQEFSDAYLIALGSSPEINPNHPLREEVYALAKMLDDFMSKGFTMDKVGELIKTKRDYESSCETYASMVDIMQISDKEKKLLKSIVNNKRQGVLTIFDVQSGKEIDEINIPEDILKKYSKNDLAAILISSLSDYKNKKIEITFLGA